MEISRRPHLSLHLSRVSLPPVTPPPQLPHASINNLLSGPQYPASEATTRTFVRTPRLPTEVPSRVQIPYAGGHCGRALFVGGTIYAETLFCHSKYFSIAAVHRFRLCHRLGKSIAAVHQLQVRHRLGNSIVRAAIH